MRPTRPYRVLRVGFAAIVLGLVMSVWVRARLVGEPMDTLWTVVVLGIVIASAYTVFGRQTMENALGTVQDLKGQSGDESEEDDA